MPPTVKTCCVCGRRYERDEAFCSTDGTPLPGGPGEAARRDPLVGMMLDSRYRILGVIGEGGMGIVYEAEHVLIEKRVAIKVLRQDFTRKPEVVARFRQEARSASRIGHPNIIDVIDFGNTPFGSSYFVMEKLEGEDLAEVLAREHVLSPARAVHLVHQCCRALAAAHQKGIFHRDLKPENLFLVRTEAGFELVKVVDFGVAKMSEPGKVDEGARRLTRTGMLFGTPEYMSPEQANGLPLDHRADIYALGVILYELVTGQVPFEGDNFMEVLNKHARQAVPPIEFANPSTQISASLRAIILRALEKDRDKRFQSMEEMAKALEAVIEMPAPSMGHVPPPWALSPPVAGTGRSANISTPMNANWARGTQLLSSSRRRWIGIGTLGVGLFLGAFLLWERPSVDEASESIVALPLAPEPAANTYVSAQAPLAVELAAEIEKPPSPVSEPRRAEQEGARDSGLVTLDLTSVPAGAKVEVDDVGILCEATPCSAGLASQSPVLLRFSVDGLHSSARVTPDHDGQLVHVNLLRRAESEKVRETTAATTPVHDFTSDLKVPEAFR